MSAYRAPVAEMMFVLNRVIGFESVGQAAGLDAGMMQTVLEEAAKFAGEVLAPLDAGGDKKGCLLQNGRVVTPPGFKDAYARFRDNGWNGVPFAPGHGGQGLPWAFAFAVAEMWHSANMAFALCPMLTQAAVEAIEIHGTKEQQDLWLAKLVSGEWTGTMNLTEPQAGSDLAAVKTKAVKRDDGLYAITGQKIFITYGEHDFAENMIHAVLARVQGAPEGVKGISLFIVPKILPDGTHNDIECTGVEHKLGIHASPTCTMQYGDKGGAVGYLVGCENEGLKYMFTMMNNARLSVGLQGVALAERAYQHALDYARNRVQGFALGDRNGQRVAIAEHPDVLRMLLTMKAKTEAVRMMTYDAALALDKARAGDKAAQARVDLLTPIVKAWCTDMAVEVASLGVQVHGGMGYIEETGAALYYRNARILPIYEGTNGIQALDLSMRKIILDKGSAARACFDDIDTVITALGPYDDMHLLQNGLASGLKRLRMATDWIVRNGATEQTAMVNVPYLEAFGTLLGGVMMARAALAAKTSGTGNSDDGFCMAQCSTAGFYASHILPQAAARLDAVTEEGGRVAAFKAALGG